MNKFKLEIESIEEEQHKKETGLMVPYLGYTPLYPEIRNASVACSLMYA